MQLYEFGDLLPAAVGLVHVQVQQRLVGSDRAFLCQRKLGIKPFCFEKIRLLPGVEDVALLIEGNNINGSDGAEHHVIGFELEQLLELLHCFRVTSQALQHHTHLHLWQR